MYCSFKFGINILLFQPEVLIQCATIKNVRGAATHIKFSFTFSEDKGDYKVSEQPGSGETAKETISKEISVETALLEPCSLNLGSEKEIYINENIPA